VDDRRPPLLGHATAKVRLAASPRPRRHTGLIFNSGAEALNTRSQAGEADLLIDLLDQTSHAPEFRNWLNEKQQRTRFGRDTIAEMHKRNPPGTKRPSARE
jgi:hypothetical protein